MSKSYGMRPEREPIRTRKGKEEEKI